MQLVKLSQYNRLIQSLGYPAETLGDLEGILTPGTVSEKNSYRINGPLNSQFEVLNGKKSEIVKVLKAETFIAVPATYGETLVVSDRLYDDAFKAQQVQDQEYGYAAYHTFSFRIGRILGMYPERFWIVSKRMRTTVIM